MQVLRLDFNGKSNSFRRTPQGFLRLKAHLTKTGVFDYENRKEFRSEEEVFRADSLDSLKGAPVTDLHPTDPFLTPKNVKKHMVGVTESIEPNGPYLKGSLLIFDEGTIKAIESGERKEISLGYKCQIDATPGTWNGQRYDAAQKNIIVNHVALGPKGWGRAGPDCSIRTDTNSSTSNKGTNEMTETVRLDGVDMALTADNVKTLHQKLKQQLEELKGRLDAKGLELEKEKTKRASLEDPRSIEERVKTRLKLTEQCKRLLGEEVRLDGKINEELKLMAIKKAYPDLDLAGKDQSYIDGLFEGLSQEECRNDSLKNTQEILHNNIQAKTNQAYEEWLEQSASFWSVPLSGHLTGGR